MKAVLFDFRNTVLRVDQAYERCEEWLYEFVRERRADVSPELFRDAWTAADRARFAAERNITVHDWTRLILTDVLGRLGLDLTAAERERAIDGYERIFVASVELYPGTTSLFEKLRARNLMLGLVIDGTKAREQSIVDRLQLHRYMHTIVISEEVQFNKFTPVPLETALKHLGCEPQHVVVVGDRIDKDIVNANNLGMVSVLLKPGTPLARNRKLDVTTADFEIGILEDVVRVVEDASAHSMRSGMAQRPAAQTAEMVTEGHADKFCDQVADAILDAALEQDPYTRAAIKGVVKGLLLFLAGEITTAASLDVESIARRVWQLIGYGAGRELTVLNYIKQQSRDIGRAVDRGGAGDQGIMVGYATAETTDMMPAEYVIARALCRRLKAAREGGEIPWLHPDGKSQVTLVDGFLTSVIIAAHHDAVVLDKTTGRLSEDAEHLLRTKVVEPVIAPYCGSRAPRVVINGTGRFTIGGPEGDTGVVGRKIVVDAYGPRVQVGGGAYSGKDPTKVDRSAAYMARHVAKAVVAHQVAGAKTCLVSIAFAIGQLQPEMMTAVTDGGLDVSEWVRAHFKDLSPSAIIESFDLRRPQANGWSYMQTAAFGHYGRDGFPWEAVPSIG